MSDPADRPIRWRLHLSSAPAKVFDLLTTDAGRRRFWAEATRTADGHITFAFPNGVHWRSQVLTLDPPRRFPLIYSGGSTVTFDLAPDEHGGTDLTLTDESVPIAHRAEVQAGWVSVLLALKAAADFGVDLRNHDPHRTWDQGFVDN